MGGHSFAKGERGLKANGLAGELQKTVDREGKKEWLGKGNRKDVLHGKS